jgi:DDE domain
VRGRDEQVDRPAEPGGPGISQVRACDSLLVPEERRGHPVRPQAPVGRVFRLGGELRGLRQLALGRVDVTHYGVPACLPLGGIGTLTGCRLGIPLCGAGQADQLLAERGVTVDHVTVYRWVQRFTPEFIEAARPGRHASGDRWFADETYIKIAGRWTYLYRAVDQYGQVVDVLLSERRDLAAARRFFTWALRAGTVPAEVITDRAPAYPRVLDELIPSALHTTERYANNRSRPPRSAEGPAPADAWPETAPVHADRDRRSCARAEFAPRPL